MTKEQAQLEEYWQLWKVKLMAGTANIEFPEAERLLELRRENGYD